MSEVGAYIKPPGATNEAWLHANATEALGPHAPKLRDVPQDSYAVCLVDNGNFTAAGIAFDEISYRIMTMPGTRPVRWFIVPRDKLRAVSNLAEYGA